MNELLLLALLVSEEPYAKVELAPKAWVEQVQWGRYRSPYRTYYQAQAIARLTTGQGQVIGDLVGNATLIGNSALGEVDANG